MVHADIDLIYWKAAQITTPADRCAYLDDICRGNDGLRRRLNQLLHAGAQAESFLETPIAGVNETSVEHMGAMVGPYKLLEQIGEGGFGVVYLAEQRDPVRRKVALKILKPGMDTKQVVNRFEAERQALALMDHPHIAKILDGGATSGGRPYFVMELVNGVPITDFCDQNKLSVRERLEQFVHICQAVQHAHQKGVIHRDIKPSNVLVTWHDTTPVVKIIDFGVAKAISIPLTDKTLFTNFAQMIGTPLYMSPEQAAMNDLDVDTRSDIYSLGVLLYELLTGQTPLGRERVKGASFDEIRRIIREDEPAKPSQKISTLNQKMTTVSQQRKCVPSTLSRLCRGELDWMTMKALEKDRNRRYETAAAFAQDVQRYLNDEPVSAGPPTVRYRLRKFMQRNRGAVVIVAAALGVVAAAIAGLTAGLIAVNNEQVRTTSALTALSKEQDATQQALAAQNRARMQTFTALRTLTDDVVADILLREPVLGESSKAYLNKVAQYYEGLAREYGDTPDGWLVQGDGQWLLARLKSEFGETKEAEAAYRSALNARSRLLAAHPDNLRFRRGVADCEIGIAQQLGKQGLREPAEALYRKGIESYTAIVDQNPDDMEACSMLSHTIGSLGLVLNASGKLREAEAAFRQALAVAPKLTANTNGVPNSRRSLASVHDHLGTVLSETARIAEAEKCFKEALVYRQKLVADYPNVALFQRDLAGSYQNLGRQYARTDRLKDAEAAFRENIVILSKLATDFPTAPRYRDELAIGQGNLATLLGQTERPEEALSLCREALAIMQKLHSDFPDVAHFRGKLANAHAQLGNALNGSGKSQEAEIEIRAAIELESKLLSEAPSAPLMQQLARSHNNLGLLLSETDRHQETEATYRKALELWTQLAADHATVADYVISQAGTTCNLATLFQSTRRLDEALVWYGKAITTLEPVLASQPRFVRARLNMRNAYWGRADTLVKLQRYADAVADWNRVIELSPPPQQPTLTIHRAMSLVHSGNSERAVATTEELLAAAKCPPNMLYNAACVFALASASAKDEARERWAVKALELLRQARTAGLFRKSEKIAEMKQDADLAALRERNDYRSFLAALEDEPPKKEVQDR